MTVTKHLPQPFTWWDWTFIRPLFVRLVLCVWNLKEKVHQVQTSFGKDLWRDLLTNVQLSGVTLSVDFAIWKEDQCEHFYFEKNISLSDFFFCRTYSLLKDDKFCAQTNEDKTDGVQKLHDKLVLNLLCLKSVVLWITLYLLYSVLQLHYLFDVSKWGIYLNESSDIWLNQSDNVFQNKLFFSWPGCFLLTFRTTLLALYKFDKFFRLWFICVLTVLIEAWKFIKLVSSAKWCAS